eukprot:444155-Prorocentrum_lima.AAC.1
MAVRFSTQNHSSVTDPSSSTTIRSSLRSARSRARTQASRVCESLAYATKSGLDRSITSHSNAYIAPSSSLAMSPRP